VTGESFREEVLFWARRGPLFVKISPSKSWQRRTKSWQSSSSDQKRSSKKFYCSSKKF
jgi:hypothetical protein